MRINIKLILLVVLILLFGYPVGYFVLGHDQNNNIQITQPIKGSVGIYVINLDRSKERYAYIKNKVNALGFPTMRLSAIDGSYIAESELHKNVDLKSYRSFLRRIPNNGTIGCYLSHIKAWETFLKSDLEFAVIFEDDISFDPQKLKLVIQDIIKSPDYWDIVTFEQRHHGFPITIKKLINNQNLVLYLTEATHSGAYIINRKAAIHLLKKAFPMRMPIDHYFTRSWEFDIKFTGIENPRLVYQTFGDSDIAKTRNIPKDKMNVSESSLRGLYKLQSYIIRFLYNLKLYLQLRFF